MKRIVLVGAGHAHAGVLRVFAQRRPAEVEIVLIAPSLDVPSSGMAPGWMAGHYRWDECSIDFPGLCRRAGAFLRIATVSAVDPDRAQLTLDNGETVRYDWLSLNIGSTLRVDSSDGMRVVPLRPLHQLQAPWTAVQETAAALPQGAQYRVVMVGGGAAGVESMLAAHHQLTQLAPHVHFRFALLTQGPDVLSGVAPGAARRLRHHLAQRGIVTVHDFSAMRIDGDVIISIDGRRVHADCAFWATGAVAHDWPRASGLRTDMEGFIRIDRNLRSVSHPNVFAVGDCARWLQPLPKAGIYAVRMGPVLARNLRAAMAGQPLQAYRPQRRYLMLIGTGDAHAVASWGALAWQGAWLWRWKQRIDRQFLVRHSFGD